MRTSKKNKKKAKENSKKKATRPRGSGCPKHTYYYWKSILHFLSCEAEGDALATVAKNIKSIVRTPDKTFFLIRCCSSLVSKNNFSRYS